MVQLARLAASHSTRTSAGMQQSNLPFSIETEHPNITVNKNTFMFADVGVTGRHGTKQHKCSNHVRCLHVFMSRNNLQRFTRVDMLQQIIHCHTFMLQRMRQVAQNNAKRHIRRRFQNKSRKYTSCKVCTHKHMLPNDGTRLLMHILQPQDVSALSKKGGQFQQAVS